MWTRKLLFLLAIWELGLFVITWVHLLTVERSTTNFKLIGVLVVPGALLLTFGIGEWVAHRKDKEPRYARVMDHDKQFSWRTMQISGRHSSRLWWDIYMFFLTAGLSYLLLLMLTLIALLTGTSDPTSEGLFDGTKPEQTETDFVARGRELSLYVCIFVTSVPLIWQSIRMIYALVLTAYPVAYINKHTMEFAVPVQQ